jgi:hypothetical protein
MPVKRPRLSQDGPAGVALGCSRKQRTRVLELPGALSRSAPSGSHNRQGVAAIIVRLSKTAVFVLHRRPDLFEALRSGAWRLGLEEAKREIIEADRKAKAEA